MPLLTVFIAPLLALYMKFRIAQFAMRILLFTAVYQLFKNSTQFIIGVLFTKIGALDLPCMASYIINSLDVLSMLNFGLSLWATIHLGRYLLNSLMKLV